MLTRVSPLADILAAGCEPPTHEWQLRVIQSDECQSYVAFNTTSHEALLIDPKVEGLASYRALAGQLTDTFDDTGSDDLPGGDAEAHYEGLQKLRRLVSPDSILLPGQDSPGGRTASWRSQLISNRSLSQAREQFLDESNAYKGDASKLLVQSLRENTK